MFSVRRFDCFPLSKGDDTFWFGSKTVGMDESLWLFGLVGVRTYLLGGAIDGSEANGIIRDPKLELESSCFTFDLVPLSYESVDVVVGENWLLRHKAEMVCHEKVVKMPWSCKVRVGSNGNLLWEASVLLGRKKGCVMDTLKFTAMPFGLTNAPAVFMELMSRVRSDLALPEGADDFVVYYDTRSKDLEACLEKGRRVGRRSEAKNEFEIDVRRSDLEMESGSYWLDKVRTSIWRDVRTLAIEEAYTTKYSIHPGADTMLCGFRLTNRWLSMKKDIASYGSKYLAYSEVEVKYQGSSGLLLQPELWVVEGLTLERCSTFGKKDKLEPSYVGPFEILGWIGSWRCSRSMTSVKSYLDKYVKQPGPKFDDKQRTIFNANKEIVLIAPRRNDVYVLDMSSLTQNRACFFAKDIESVNWLWHKRLSHLNFKNINKLAKQNKVLDLPSLVYSKDKPCFACEKGNIIELLLKPSKITPSRNACIFFIRTYLDQLVKNQNDVKVKQIRTDNGTEFRNSKLESFCDEKRISQNFSSPYTLEQNGVAERKNITLIEAA
ncbi:retrovirus-related pol polyprotein from transposon TNT 1-94 [Tanacetum coccineum]